MSTSQEIKLCKTVNCKCQRELITGPKPARPVWTANPPPSHGYSQLTLRFLILCEYFKRLKLSLFLYRIVFLKLIGLTIS